MKIRAIAIATLVAGSFAGYAQKAVKVNGQIESGNKTVKLYAVKEGKIEEIASAVPQNKKFGFLFYPKYEGFYVIGTGNTASPSDNYNFYFKGGEQLDLTLKENTYVLNGTLNSKENQIMKQWQELTQPIYQKSINFFRIQSTFLDYFPEQEAIVAKSKTFLKDKKSGNPKFDKAIGHFMEMDLITYASNFLNTPRSAHPSIEELSDYYASINTKNISKTTDQIYTYPWGLRSLSGLLMINMRQDKKAFKPGLEGQKIRMEYLVNDTLKGDLALNYLAGLKNYDDYQAGFSIFGKYILTKSQKDRAEAIMSPLLTYKPGTDGLAFSFPDKNGKTITFASLRGKVVLVDVWATWCGPCRAEFPYLKQLEKDVEGQPIQIVSISTDAEKDKEKWLKMIKDENLGGLQLYAGQNNEFSRHYKVNTIPRFLVFDKNGKIVSVDAPRPSNPKLKDLLLAEAAK